MRSLLRAGLLLGLVAAACKESAAPGDFTDPVAVSNDLTLVAGAFDSDVYRSFQGTTSQLYVAAPSAMRPMASIVHGLRPELSGTGARPLIIDGARALAIKSALPQLSDAAAQGRIIPDSLYGRVFEWDTVSNGYTWQGTTVPGLNGVRFVLYAVGLDHQVLEPVTAIGTLDIIDESTLSTLQLHILVQGPGGNPTYLDYTVSLTVNGQTSATASVSGFLSNGQAAAANKTLTFDETVTVTQTRASLSATFALNNPAITLTFTETVTFESNALVITADFRVVRPGETVQVYGRVTLNFADTTVSAYIVVRANGRTVASLTGDPSVAQWVDAGGDPLTADDLAALHDLLESFELFEDAVDHLFEPVGTFAGF